MAKQQALQKYIFKINTSRLRKAKWNLTLPLSEARKNDEIISLSDSLMLRWIDELNGVTDAEERARQIKSRIRYIKKLPYTLPNRREIRRLYEELDSVQFKPDYMHLVIDKEKDFHRACRGFKINGIKYVRLLGTNGGVKSSTIVFVSERLASELRIRIDNGRNHDVPQIPAKFEAYRALTCSGSIPVSMPHGIIIIPDCKTMFKEDILFLSDANSGEPEMTFMKDHDIVLDESDGYGMMLPSLARRWSEELGLDYVAGGMNTRFSYEKGMVFCFDFLDFADKIAGTRIVKDAWGNEVDLSDIELILTTSMLKLWRCYDSIDQYLRCCNEHHYTFGITKTSPAFLENRRNLNYQFIQSYDLSDEQIDELIKPTMDELNDILSGDYRKALLFLAGTHLDESYISRMDDGFIKALMIDPSLFNDQYVRNKIYQMIRKRIDDAKIGVISVHGNYSIVCGDPYALCQSMFGLRVTGLLKAGQLYNKYWSDNGAECVACYRAPMTCHNNIRKMEVARGEDVSYWYRYINACTLFNAWDTSAQALNGMDKDGDLVMLTDNRILVENIRSTPTIYCVQRSATSMDVTEHDLIKSNIASFGDDIGKTTNYITSMFDVQAQFDKDSDEYKVLDYRIKCGQNYQQNCIDKAKGIICKPMPRYWYDRAANRLSDNPSKDEIAAHDFNISIVADKKPYFMRYIYPTLMKQYNTYIRNTNTKCLRAYRMTINELLSIPEDELTDDQKSFIYYYHSRVPVGMNNCVMNRICRRFEAEFDGRTFLHSIEHEFDYSVLKSGVEYTVSQYNEIKKIFKERAEKAKEHQIAIKNNREDDSQSGFIANVAEYFKSECSKVCSDDNVVCDIIVDMCYKSTGTKQFVWDVASETIVHNLLRANGMTIRYPAPDPLGDIEFGGGTYSMRSMEVVYE